MQRNNYEPEPDEPKVKRIFTRSLTEPSHGNTAGVGMAEFIHGDLLRDQDLS